MPPTADTPALDALVQLDSLNESQVQQFYELVQREWGPKGGSLDDLRLMLQDSSVIVAFADVHSSRLVACGRVLTDFIFQATIHGIVVAEDWRGRGVGRRLMDALVHHPRLQRVRSMWLRCVPEVEAFYKKWGFAVAVDGATWMRRQRGEANGDGWASALMDDQLAVKTLLQELELSLLQSSNRTSGAVEELLADEFLEFGASGRRLTKPGIVAALESEPPVEITVSQLEVDLLSPDIALVTYLAVHHLQPAVQSLRSSIWQQQQGRWQMVFHQGTTSATS